MKRRECLVQLSALPFLPIGTLTTQSDTIRTRSIPSSDEALPVIGVGTWRTFDVGNSESDRSPLTKVLQTLIRRGGQVIDSSPMYGRSEGVVGDLSTQSGLNQKLFIATKVWTSGKENGIQQMNRSFELMKRQKVDLMQIHNLIDWQTHLKTLREWKDQGKIRYLGITHYTESAYDSVEQILKREPLDFLQINYSLLRRTADERLLPLAREKNVAVIINQPFESGSLFNRIRGRSLPAWASEFDCKNWAQFFLKFIISHPAVTCAIPGTSNPDHMLENIGAGYGQLPTEQQRLQMIKVLS